MAGSGRVPGGATELGAAAGLAAEAVQQRLGALALRFDVAARNITEAAGALRAETVPEWQGGAADAYRVRVGEHSRELEAVAEQCTSVADTLRLAATVLAHQVAASGPLGQLGALAPSLTGLLAGVLPPSAVAALSGAGAGVSGATGGPGDTGARAAPGVVRAW